MRMKRFGIACALAGWLVAAVAGAAPSAMSVQVKKADVRSEPSFLGASVAALVYGDRVQVAAEQGSWMKVTTAQGVTGWVHNSALTKKTIVLSSGGAVQTGASSGELALAGKGFNADVEKQFKANHQDISFKWVDRMEKFKVTPEQATAFHKAGGLVANGGAQ